jgi:hypothetical protein
MLDALRALAVSPNHDREELAKWLSVVVRGLRTKNLKAK